MWLGKVTTLTRDARRYQAWDNIKEQIKSAATICNMYVDVEQNVSA